MPADPVLDNGRTQHGRARPGAAPGAGRTPVHAMRSARTSTTRPALAPPAAPAGQDGGPPHDRTPVPRQGGNVPAPLARPAERVLTRPRRRLAGRAGGPRRPGSPWARPLCSRYAPRRRDRRDAPADEFSAGRAYAARQVVAARTHPAGSAANDQVRAHLERRAARRWAWRPRCRTPSAPEAGQLSGAAGGRDPGPGTQRGGPAARHRPDRPGLPGGPLRLGADRPRRQRRRGRHLGRCWRWPGR